MEHAIELQTDYIKRFKGRKDRWVVVQVAVEEDYNHETDGYDMRLVQMSGSLSLPDSSGCNDIDRIRFGLLDSIDETKLVPGTSYMVKMVECEEEDGWPSIMLTWAVESVEMNSLYESAPAGAQTTEE